MNTSGPNPVNNFYRYYCSADNNGGVNSYNRILNIPSGKKSAGYSGYQYPGAPEFPEYFAGYNSARLNRLTTQELPDWPAFHNSPNILLLTPTILGGAALFILSFGFYGHCLTGGYNKYIFFANIYAIIASLGVGAYIYEARMDDASLGDIIVPALLLIFFFSVLYNLTYSLYPESFSGTIGDTPLTQYFSFLSISIGAISVGETLNVTPEKASTQILVAIEAVFSLFVLSLIIAVVAAPKPIK